MGSGLQSGELVVRRIRWGVDAQQFGLVIGQIREGEWLVMWHEDDRVGFKVHLADALLVVNDHNAKQVEGRWHLAT